MSTTGAGEFSVDVTVERGRTVFEVRGTREAAVVVRSEGDERIYLPPEGFDAPAGADSPYQSARDSPYQGGDSPYQRSDSPYQSGDSPYQSAGEVDSPYQSARSPSRSVGTSLVDGGFRVVHPEPVDEFRVYR